MKLMPDKNRLPAHSSRLTRWILSLALLSSTVPTSTFAQEISLQVDSTLQNVPSDKVSSDEVRSEPASATDAASPMPQASETVTSGESTAVMEGPPAAPSLMTLSAVMSKVWGQHPQVQQAERTLEGTGYDISGARAGYFPYLQVQSSFASSQENGNSTLIFVQPLWSGGSTGGQVDQAKARQQVAAADLVKIRQTLGQRTLEAYLRVAQAQEQSVQWANYVGALKKLLSSIERRAASGVAPTSDVQTAVSRLRQAQVGAEGNRAQLLTGRAQLASLINMTPTGVDWPDEMYAMSDEEIEAANDRIDLHPDLVKARNEVDLQAAIAKTTKATLWPELSLQHRRQYEGQIFDPTNDDTTLLVLQFQTSNGLRGLRGFQAEERRLNAARARVDSVSRDTTSTIQIDKAQLRAVSSQLIVQEQAAIAATALVDSFTRQFEVGRRNWLEVLNAHREAHEIMLQSIALKSNYWYANCKLALDAMYWERISAEFAQLDKAP